MRRVKAIDLSNCDSKRVMLSDFKQQNDNMVKFI